MITKHRICDTINGARTMHADVIENDLFSSGNNDSL